MATPSILLIDDDPAILSIFSMALKFEGFEVLIADNAMDALNLARRLRPQIILCDLNMPQISGEALVQAIRSDANLESTKILLMTGRLDDPDADEPPDYLADALLIKPFDCQYLVDQIRGVMDSPLNP